MEPEEKRQAVIKFLNQELTNAAIDCQLDRLYDESALNDEAFGQGLAQGIRYALTHTNEQISMMLYKGAHGVWDFND